MPTTTKVKNLNINELTEAQYDAAVQGGVIGANELSVLTDVEYVEPSDLATVATTGDYSDLINRPTNLVSTNTAQTISGMKTFSGDITLSGTTSIKNNTGGTNYTMLYRDATTIHVGASTSVLKLEGSGTRPAYNNDSLALLSDITGGLPSQTGHSGEFLTTDGTDASWSDKPVVNRATGIEALAIGTASTSATNLASIAIGQSAVCTGERAIQFGYGTNNENNTMKVSLGYDSFTNYKLLDSDGTIPEARLADTTNAQQGDVLTLDANGDAVWQAGGGGSSYTAGTGIDITSGTISVTSPTVQNFARTTTGRSFVVGYDRNFVYENQNGYNNTIVNGSNQGSGNYICIFGGSSTAGQASSYSCIYGYAAKSYAQYGVAIGSGATVSTNAQYAIQIGGNNQSNADANTFKVANANGNFEMMSADGTIPTARLTKVNTTITLAAADWSSNTQTVSVTGMTATGVVLVSPDPTDQSAYTSAGIICSAQAAGTLTFTCSTTPSADLSVNVVML